MQQIENQKKALNLQTIFLFYENIYLLHTASFPVNAGNANCGKQQKLYRSD